MEAMERDAILIFPTADLVLMLSVEVTWLNQGSDVVFPMKNHMPILNKYIKLKWLSTYCRQNKLQNVYIVHTFHFKFV